MFSKIWNDSVNIVTSVGSVIYNIGSKTNNAIKQFSISHATEPNYVDESGTQFWIYNNKIHRDEVDENGEKLPAVVYKNGTKLWYRHGLKHRSDDKPAAEYPNGDKFWWIDGVLHRITYAGDKQNPAIIKSDGYRAWYVEGLLDSPWDDNKSCRAPAVIEANGNKHWYSYGQRHRDDGPAIIENGVEYWYSYGQLHREFGKPAVVYTNGMDKQYWINGIKLNYKVEGSSRVVDDSDSTIVINNVNDPSTDINTTLDQA